MDRLALLYGEDVPRDFVERHDDECNWELRQRMHNCCLFLDDHDHIGVGTYAVRKGDMLSYLRGCGSLSILREVGEDRWKLVSGDCDIDGFPSLPGDGKDDLDIEAENMAAVLGVTERTFDIW